MLEDILGCVQEEPATGPWYAVRYAPTVFGIFEVFPDRAGRPAHVHRLDVLMGKAVFAGR